jgi:hypothetical protein
MRYITLFICLFVLPISLFSGAHGTTLTPITVPPELANPYALQGPFYSKATLNFHLGILTDKHKYAKAELKLLQTESSIEAVDRLTRWRDAELHTKAVKYRNDKAMLNHAFEVVHEQYEYQVAKITRAYSNKEERVAWLEEKIGLLQEAITQIQTMISEAKRLKKERARNLLLNRATNNLTSKASPILQNNNPGDALKRDVTGNPAAIKLNNSLFGIGINSELKNP